MARVLTVAAVIWPLFLAAGWQARVEAQAPWLAASAYVVGAQICHQRSERSFHSAGVKWPVCGRCSGLYLAAPLGALLAWRRRRPLDTGRNARVFVACAAPTLLTWTAEAAGIMELSSAVRAASAIPLGAVVAYLIVSLAREPRAAIG
jgi:uncharacterized membrane protein